MIQNRVNEMKNALRVLNIEDDVFFTELLAIELRRAGFDLIVKRIETREEMDAALDKEEWDVILSDHNLPRFDGFTALSLLKEKGVDTPFFLVSAILSDDLAVQAMRSGAQDYFMKGNLKRLVPSIERELREVEIRRKLKEEERIAAQSDVRFKTLVENIQEVFWMTDIKKEILTYVSPLYEEVWGCTCESLYRDSGSWLEVVHDEDRERISHVVRTKQSSGGYDEAFRIVRPNGAIRWIRSRAFPVRNGAQEITHVVGISQDITKLKEKERQIASLAYFDALTHLPNRVKFTKFLKDAIQDGVKTETPFSVLIIDLDNFRAVNDTLGHSFGDLLLQEVGKRLQQTLRSSDSIARIGGDEFGLILPVSDEDHATLAAAKVSKVLEKPFMVQNIPVSIEPSIGIAMFPAHGLSADALLRRADIAMYEAKRRGCVYVTYNAQYDKYTPERLALMGELRPAIQNSQLQLYYQPEIDLQSGRITAAEALVRWNHPERGNIQPDAIILPAEQTGLIAPLTEWVLREALHQCSLWHHNGHRLRVAVNVSARNLHFQLIEQIEDALKYEGMDPSNLILELTESAIMADEAIVKQVFAELRNMGVLLSIDDFGTGYSSLSYLKRLAVDVLKIDQSFIKNMTASKEDAMITNTIITLAHNLGLDVVAEGVENEETYKILYACGCDITQGYFISPPLPINDFNHWLLKAAPQRGWQVSDRKNHEIKKSRTQKKPNKRHAPEGI